RENDRCLQWSRSSGPVSSATRKGPITGDEPRNNVTAASIIAASAVTDISDGNSVPRFTDTSTNAASTTTGATSGQVAPATTTQTESPATTATASRPQQYSGSRRACGPATVVASTRCSDDPASASFTVRGAPRRVPPRARHGRPDARAPSRSNR